jgi:hypothetical protein
MTAPVVLSHRGTPEPSSEIQRRLAAVHPRLFLRFVEVFDAHWALCMRWEENDRRYAEMQQQTIDPDRAFDIIGYLPMDCSVDTAPSYIERALRQYPVEEVRRVADFVQEFNATAPVAAAIEQAMAEVLDAPVAKKRGRPSKAS